MKPFGKDWVLQTAQCPDGTTWGLDYVTNGAKDLPEAVEGFERADWLIWFLVKAGVIPLFMALDIVRDLTLGHINTTDARAMLKQAVQVEHSVSDAVKIERIHALRNNFAQEAEHLMFSKEFSRGHEVSAVTFFLRMRAHLIEGDDDEALKDAQCVLNNLVAARTGSLNFTTPAAKLEHKTLCAYLRSCVIVGKAK